MMEKIEKNDESIDPNYKRTYYERKLKPLKLFEMYEERTIMVCVLDDREIKNCMFPSTRPCEDCTIYKWYMEGVENAYEKFLNMMRQLWD